MCWHAATPRERHAEGVDGEMEDRCVRGSIHLFHGSSAQAGYRVARSQPSTHSLACSSSDTVVRPRSLAIQHE